jgi:hypothetical protein
MTWEVLSQIPPSNVVRGVIIVPVHSFWFSPCHGRTGRLAEVGHGGRALLFLCATLWLHPPSMLLCRACPCLLCRAFSTSSTACSIVDVAPSLDLTRQTPSCCASCATCSVKCETQQSMHWPSLGIRRRHRFSCQMLDETPDPRNCHHYNSFTASCVPAGETRSPRSI